MKKPENIYVSTATQCIQKQKNKDEKHKPLETAAQKCSYTTEQQQQHQQQQQQPQRRQRQRQQQQEEEEEEYARMDSKQ